MPFEPVEVVNKHNRPPQASISYERAERKTRKGLTKSKTPHLMISIPTTISGVSKKKFFMLQLGTGEDAGKARISGRAAATKHTVERRDLMHATTFDFGFVPMLGDDAAAKEFVGVRKISDDEFEIDLPKWFSAEREPAPPCDEEEAAPPHIPLAGGTGPAKPVARPASRQTGGDPQVIKGLSINLALDDESISFAGKETDITTDQACLALALAKGAPNPIGRDHLLKKL
jgi:hypothetical protein